MKKLLISTVLLLLAAYTAGADDIITKINGEQIRAKVMEIGDDSVKFKRMDNPNGPVYVLNQSEIQSIEYENGVVEEYSKPAPEPEVYFADRYDVRYRDIAGIYKPEQYQEQTDDPYPVLLSGMASFLIPGLGQCIDGEWGRGFGIMAANIGFGLLELTEASIMFYSAADSSSYYRDNELSYAKANALFGASFCAALLTMTARCAFNIWNIFDAVNIAKAKNMYYRDLSIQPNLAFTPSSGMGLQPTAGIGLKLSF